MSLESPSNQWGCKKKKKKCPDLNPISSSFFFLSPLSTIFAFIGTRRTLTAFCALGCCHCFITQAQVALLMEGHIHTPTQEEHERLYCLSADAHYTSMKIHFENWLFPWETLVGDYIARFMCFQSCILALNFSGTLIWDDWIENNTISYPISKSIWGLWFIA